MPTGGELDLLVDTSVAVPLVVADHDHHDSVVRALAGQHLGLAGHAAFETFSVLTRLPPPVRRTPGSAVRMMTANFPHSRHVSQEAAASMLEQLASAGISGGAVYDALVGLAAREHGVVLCTRDRRALETYRALNVEIELID
ncbi:type II toxin-antitoxin system VapC family toxin [Jiangella alkaliphila]|uniref:Ribonuclease VapC n=1 Tax=Jiangella alkaliphila TaxID=419479 RepID=A0A1H2L668_9ACTN|nr:type II toxin-antitoxin system VapC family toxin [Jiangella alkaliphila]SDU76058.1 Predicted nucleic acid-binding protein, contains PIN domain [Jiangella alkaliphila]